MLLLLLQLAYFRHISTLICLFVLNAFFVHKLLRAVLVLRLVRHRGETIVKSLKREIFHYFMLNAFIVLLLLYTHGTLNALFSFIPLVISFLVYVCNSQWPESPCLSLVHLLKTTGVILRICLVGTSLLKVEDYISWTWTTTFWPLWCALAVLSILSVFSVALMFYSLHQGCRGNMRCDASMASIWAFFVTSGLSVSMMYIAITIILEYDSFSTT